MQLTVNYSPQEARLLEMGAMGFVAIKQGFVNIDDLLNVRPGSIVRCMEKPEDCIKFFSVDSPELGCVAGWISDDA